MKLIIEPTMKHLWLLALCGLVCSSSMPVQAAEQEDPVVKARAAEIKSKASQLSDKVRREVAQPRKVPLAGPLVFQAGAAAVDITPQKPLYLDGYWNHRLSTGVHSPLYAKAIVLDDGRTRTAFVILDQIAFFHPWVRETRSMQGAVRPENVTIGATHTHSSPCLLGVFGPEGKSVDMEYVNWIKKQAAEAIKQAAANLKPARLGFARTDLPVEDGAIVAAAVNWHNKGVVEAALPIMRLEELESRKPMPTLVNFGNHPDKLGTNTTQASADCFHHISQFVCGQFGGVTLVFSRSNGGIKPLRQGKARMTWRKLKNTCNASVALSQKMWQRP